MAIKFSSTQVASAQMVADARTAWRAEATRADGRLAQFAAARMAERAARGTTAGLEAARAVRRAEAALHTAQMAAAGALQTLQVAEAWYARVFAQRVA